MQQLYFTKSIISVLLIASIHTFGMEINLKKKTIDQETEINSYVKEIAKNRYDEVEALRQEKAILWYTKVTSGQRVKKLKAKNLNLIPLKK